MRVWSPLRRYTLRDADEKNDGCYEPPSPLWLDFAAGLQATACPGLKPAGRGDARRQGKVRNDFRRSEIATDHGVHRPLCERRDSERRIDTAHVAAGDDRSVDDVQALVALDAS